VSEGVRNPTIITANRHKVELVRLVQQAGRIGRHLPAEILLELPFGIVMSSFDGVIPVHGPTEPKAGRPRGAAR